MATYHKRGSRTLARIRKKGHPEMARTFATRKLAEDWAEDIERGIGRGVQVNHRALAENDVRGVLERYRDEVSPLKKGYRWEFNKINQILGVAFRTLESGAQEEYSLNSGALWTYLTFDQDIAAGIQTWRDERLKSVKAQSFNRELNLISAVFTHAAKEWQLRVSNPVKNVKRPTATPGDRELTWTPKQVQLFCDFWGWSEDKPVEKQTQWAGWALQLGLATGVRRGSMMRLETDWIDLDEACIRFPADVVKAGAKYDMPLEGRGLELIQKLLALRQGETKLFGCGADSITSYVTAARKELVEKHPDVAGLTLHDTRHSYTTELVELGVDMPTLMKIMGRSSFKDTMRYYNPKPKTLAETIAAKRAAAARR